ncbi:hypothetical protein SELMODRAFT_170012 [Selaginella moellendorffii]|uniref:Cytochrome b5 heme-binding domain-containing protein n=1 Tax=Selaginella moellendorffii TaxID=88036 RepID=D8RBT1_SELML|nr:cytochrome b5 [Selaginella moellendorffii]EFJ30841.1 hypothetical protein SELMODRAFT_170012 [Selaginella moellendorffii]|eukprot:XP_002968587.1 cytochrome b5 [Selaginella moellendorffii]
MGDLSAAEVAKHKSATDCWFIINGKVYDVTNFLVDHPGGEDALLAVAGKDASQDFEEVGHSDSAKEQMEQFLVGFVEGYAGDKDSRPAKRSAVEEEEEEPVMRPLAIDPADRPSVFLKYVVPLLLLCLAFALQFFGKKKIPEDPSS